MRLHCYYEETCFFGKGFIKALFSTNDKSAANTKQRNTYARKANYLFTCYLDESYLMEPLDKRKEYILIGEWEIQNRIHVFRAADVEIYVGKEKDDIIEFLTNIKGVGEKTALKIYDAFQDKTLDVLKNDFDRLVSTVKLSKAVIENIKKVLTAKIRYKEVVDYLLQFSLSSKKINNIYLKYGDEAPAFISENPFMVSEDGTINFIDANSIAIQLGICLKSNMRIAQGIEYFMREYSNKGGDLFADIEDLCRMVKMILNEGVETRYQVTDKDIKEVLKQMLKSEKLKSILHGKYIYLIRDFKAETETAKLIINHVHNKNCFKIEKNECEDMISDLETETGILLNIEQRRAIETAMENTLTVITGGPGTGKTTLLKFLISIFQKKFGDRIGLCAPTGKAARRMAESTGINGATTIHSLLGLDAGYTWDIQRPLFPKLDYDFVVVDETSMIDMDLAFVFLSSIPETCKILFIGDVNQLPSVGAGDVLKQIIISGVVPVARLEKIYRQAANSLIIKNAILLNQRKTNFSYDNSFILKHGGSDVNAQIANMYLKLLKKGYKKSEVQILTPYRKDVYPGSTNKLNEIIQSKINPYNPYKKEIKTGLYAFREGDIVIQQRNTDMIKNGDIGTIQRVYISENSGLPTAVIKFEDDRTVDYDEFAIRDNKVDLAYALTVHKSQGAEYKTVIMPCLWEYKSMLTKNLLYTAWTRAKEHMVIVGDINCIVFDKYEERKGNRHSYLGLRLQNAEKAYCESHKMNTLTKEITKVY